MISISFDEIFDENFTVFSCFLIQKKLGSAAAKHIRWCTAKTSFQKDSDGKNLSPFEDPGLAQFDEYISAFHGDYEDVFKVFADSETNAFYERTVVKIAAELLDQVKKLQ